MSDNISEKNVVNQGLSAVLVELVNNIGVARNHTAQEIEKLSEHFGMLSQNVGQMNQLSQQLAQAVTPGTAEDTQQSLDNIHNQLQSYSGDIGQEISDILVALQFQDRVNQILMQVEQNLIELSTQDGNVDWHQMLAQTTETFHRFDGGWAGNDENNEAEDAELTFF